MPHPERTEKVSKFAILLTYKGLESLYIRIFFCIKSTDFLTAD